MNKSTKAKASKQGVRKSVRFFWILFFSGVGLVALVITLAASGAFGKMPSLKQLENPSILQSSEVFASDGTLMGKYYREHGNRSNVSYKDISKHVIDALVATEDERGIFTRTWTTGAGFLMWRRNCKAMFRTIRAARPKA